MTRAAVPVGSQPNGRQPMLMRAEISCLLVVDFQERLMPAIHHGDQVVANGAWLIGIA